MKVKVPSKINFLTHEYTVMFGAKELASQGCVGLTRHLYQEIILDNTTTPKSEVDQTFLHEFVHVIERHTGMKFDDADIERLSEGIADLFFRTLGIELDWSEVEEAGE